MDPTAPQSDAADNAIHKSHDFGVPANSSWSSTPEQNDPSAVPARFHDPSNPAQGSLNVPEPEHISAPRVHPDELNAHPDPVVPMPNQSFAPSAPADHTPAMSPPPVVPDVVPPVTPASAVVQPGSAPAGVILSTEPAIGTAPIGMPTLGSHENVAPPIALPPELAKPRKNKLKFFIVAGVLSTLLIGGVGYAAYNYTTIEPKNALATYLQKAGTSKSANYSGSVEVDNLDSSELLAQAKSTSSGSGSQSLFNSQAIQKLTDDISTTSGSNSSVPSSVKLNYSGAYDINDASSPKYDISLDTEVEGQKYGGELRFLNNTIFFKLTDLGALRDYLNLTSDWYKYGVDSSTVTQQTDKCFVNPSQDKTISEAFLVDFPVKNTKRIGLSENIDGHSTAHFSGEIDFSKLQAEIDKANKKLTSDCQIQTKSSDFDGLSVTYDVWSGSNFDRTKFMIGTTKDKATATIITDTSDYNKAVNIVAPDGAKDLNDYLNSITSDDGTTSGSAFITNGTKIPSSASSSSRNAQRQADVTAILNAVDQYQSQNGGVLPAGITTTPTAICKTDAKCDVIIDLSSVTSSGTTITKIPVDPSTTGQYSTGYDISKDSAGHVTVSAPLAEDGATIVATH